MSQTCPNLLVQMLLHRLPSDGLNTCTVHFNEHAPYNAKTQLIHSA